MFSNGKFRSLEHIHQAQVSKCKPHWISWNRLMIVSVPIVNRILWQIPWVDSTENFDLSHHNWSLNHRGARNCFRWFAFETKKNHHAMGRARSQEVLHSCSTKCRQCPNDSRCQVSTAVAFLHLALEHFWCWSRCFQRCSFHWFRTMH